MSTQMKLLVAVLVAALAVPLAGAEERTGVAGKSLYERLGGLKGITLVSDDFIDRLVKNATLNKNKAINAGRKSSPPPYLKFQVSQLVCEVTGGPCKYTGKHMKEDHPHLPITTTATNNITPTSTTPP